MKLRDILISQCVLDHLVSTQKEPVLQELAACLSAQLEGVPQNEVYQILLDREKLGSTGIGNGVAIPHGKIAQLKHVVAAFGRSLEGIDFESQDNKPAHLFFVLLAPENAASLHLKALARLSRLLKDHDFRLRLLEAKASEDIYRIITEEDEKIG